MCGPGAADLLGQLLVCRAEVVKQLLVSCGLLEGVQLLAVQVFQQRVSEHVIVVRLPDNGRDVLQTCPLGSAPAALTHHEFVASAAKAAHHYRLQQPYLGDGGGEFIESVVVEGAPWLSRVRRNRVDRDFLEIGPRDLAQGGVSCGLRRGLIDARALFAADR